MSYATLENPKVITFSRYSFISDSVPVKYESKINASTSTNMKMQKKKIVLTILSNFVPNPSTIVDVINFSFARKLDSKLEIYLKLIDEHFPNNTLSANVFSDKEANYESLFITIQSSFNPKSSEKKYMKLLKKISRSNHYSELIDVDYSSS